MSGLVASGSAIGLGVFAGRALIAMALGAVIGLERQWRQRMAGLRTNALVALGAALFELVSVMLLAGLRDIDTTRIAAYIVSGIGFLGAGVILRDGVNVRGINTAATIWCSAAVGVLSGAGYVIQAVIAAALVVLVHVGLRPVARRIDRLPAAPDSEVQTLYRFRVVCRSEDEAHIRASVAQALSGDQFVLKALRSEDLEGRTDRVEVTAELERQGRDDVALEHAVSRLSLEPGVSAVTWSVIEPVLPLATQEG